MIYPAKKDWWLACILVGNGLALVGIAVAGLIVALVHAGAPNPSWRVFPDGLLSLYLGMVGGMGLWLFFSASYEITPSEMIARLGPLRRRVSLAAIEEVQRRPGFSLKWGENYALSLDRLRIRYRRSSGRMAWLPIEISPRDKEGFLQELARSAPGLLPGPDGGLRRPEAAALQS